MFTREIPLRRPTLFFCYHNVYYTEPRLLHFKSRNYTNLTVHRHLVDPGTLEEIHPVNHLDLEQYNTSYVVPDTAEPTCNIEQHFRLNVRSEKKNFAYLIPLTNTGTLLLN